MLHELYRIILSEKMPLNLYPLYLEEYNYSPASFHQNYQPPASSEQFLKFSIQAYISGWSLKGPAPLLLLLIIFVPFYSVSVSTLPISSMDSYLLRPFGRNPYVFDIKKWPVKRATIRSIDSTRSEFKQPLIDADTDPVLQNHQYSHH